MVLVYKVSADYIFGGGNLSKIGKNEDGNISKIGKNGWQFFSKSGENGDGNISEICKNTKNCSHLYVYT